MTHNSPKTKTLYILFVTFSQLMFDGVEVICKLVPLTV